MKELNTFTDHIKFTSEFDQENINFLDVDINLFNGHLMTNMYIKSTDCRQYLGYSSSHPSHTKRSIVYSQPLKARRLCLLESDFLKPCTKMKPWFLKRGYTEDMIDNKMKKSSFSENVNKKSKKSKVVPFHLSLNCLSRIIIGNLNILNHELNCYDKCLIYLLKCRFCKKQYVGETTDAFRLRWNNSEDNDRKFLRNESYMQQHLYENFSDWQD